MKQLDDIMADCILAVEPLGPGEECALVERSLFDGETEKADKVSNFSVTLLMGTDLKVKPR